MNQTTQRVDECYSQAKRALAGYLKSGLAGQYQQGIDRLASVGIKLDAFQEASRANADHLLQHISR